MKLKYEMSFWLIDLQVGELVIVAFKRQLNIFSYIMARNSYDDEIRLVQAHWKNSPWIDMTYYPDSLILFLNADCMTEKQQIPI